MVSMRSIIQPPLLFSLGCVSAVPPTLRWRFDGGDALVEFLIGLLSLFWENLGRCGWPSVLKRISRDGFGRDVIVGLWMIISASCKSGWLTIIPLCYVVVFGIRCMRRRYLGFS